MRARIRAMAVASALALGMAIPAMASTADVQMEDVGDGTTVVTVDLDDLEVRAEDRQDMDEREARDADVVATVNWEDMSADERGDDDGILGILGDDNTEDDDEGILDIFDDEGQDDDGVLGIFGDDDAEDDDEGILDILDVFDDEGEDGGGLL